MANDIGWGKAVNNDIGWGAYPDNSIGAGSVYAVSEFGETAGIKESSDEFIISVKTDNTGTSNNDQFTLPMIAGTYDVDWGDTNVDLEQTGTQTHTYSVAGTYEIKVTGGTQLKFNGTGDGDKLLDIVNWGANVWTDMTSMFYGCDNTVMSATDAPDLSSVTLLNTTFRNCKALNVSIEHWDTSDITLFYSLFRGCDIYNQPLNAISTASATDFRYMFHGAWAFNQDISSFDLTGATSINDMFLNAVAFNQDISSWNTSSIVNMQNLFNGAAAFDQDLSSWDINQVTALVNFMLGVTLSTANYDAMLIAWDAQGAMGFSGTVNFGSSTYTSGGAAETARTSLIAKWGGITDGGAA